MELVLAELLGRLAESEGLISRNCGPNTGQDNCRRPLQLATDWHRRVPGTSCGHSAHCPVARGPRAKRSRQTPASFRRRCGLDPWRRLSLDLAGAYFPQDRRTGQSRPQACRRRACASTCGGRQVCPPRAPMQPCAAIPGVGRSSPGGVPVPERIRVHRRTMAAGSVGVPFRRPSGFAATG